MSKPKLYIYTNWQSKNKSNRCRIWKFENKMIRELIFQKPVYMLVKRTSAIVEMKNHCCHSPIEFVWIYVVCYYFRRCVLVTSTLLIFYISFLRLQISLHIHVLQLLTIIFIRLAKLWMKLSFIFEKWYSFYCSRKGMPLP